MLRKLLFVIPAYNEAKNLPHLLDTFSRVERFLETPIQIILVDDGSQDETPSILEHYKKDIDLSVIRHGINLGPGAAFRNGFLRAIELSNQDDIIVTIEADNTSDLCVLSRMIEKLDRGNDVVLASVYGNGMIAGTTYFRRFLSSCANLLMKITLRIPGVNTFTSFFRVYRYSALKKLMTVYGDSSIQENGFTCMLEILIKFHLLGLKITEVPMLLDGNIRLGESKMKIFRNMQATLVVIGKHLFSDTYRPKVG